MGIAEYCVDEKIYKFDEEQYQLLLKCSAQMDITDWNNWRLDNPDVTVWLQGPAANFDKCNIKGANLRNAHLEGATFRRANCSKVDFYRARLEDTSFWNAQCVYADFWQSRCVSTLFYGADCYCANFSDAHIEDSSFSHSNCKGARFSHSAIDQESKFLAICIDDSTDFTTSGFTDANTDPGTMSKVQQNIRRFYWESWKRKEWVETKRISRMLFKLNLKILRSYKNVRKNIGCLFDGVMSKMHDSRLLKDNPEVLILISMTLNCILAAQRLLSISFVSFFWHISDYGYSTKRIVFWFSAFILFFASIYTLFPSMLSIGNTPLDEVSFIQMVAYSTSTMITLGFGNINVGLLETSGELIEPNGFGMLVVTTNLLVGYFMLGVFVTRLAVLFQTMAPGYIPPK